MFSLFFYNFISYSFGPCYTKYFYLYRKKITRILFPAPNVPEYMYNRFLGNFCINFYLYQFETITRYFRTENQIACVPFQHDKMVRISVHVFLKGWFLERKQGDNFDTREAFLSLAMNFRFILALSLYRKTRTISTTAYRRTLKRELDSSFLMRVTCTRSFVHQRKLIS